MNAAWIIDALKARLAEFDDLMVRVDHGLRLGDQEAVYVTFANVPRGASELEALNAPFSPMISITSPAWKVGADAPKKITAKQFRGNGPTMRAITSDVPHVVDHVATFFAGHRGLIRGASPQLTDKQEEALRGIAEGRANAFDYGSTTVNVLRKVGLVEGKGTLALTPAGQAHVGRKANPAGPPDMSRVPTVAELERDLRAAEARGESARNLKSLRLLIEDRKRKEAAARAPAPPPPGAPSRYQPKAGTQHRYVVYGWPKSKAAAFTIDATDTYDVIAQLNQRARDQGEFTSTSYIRGDITTYPDVITAFSNAYGKPPSTFAGATLIHETYGLQNQPTIGLKQRVYAMLPQRRANPTGGMDVAEGILQQLGGAGVLSAMIGAKDFLAMDHGLKFRFTAKATNGANTVVIRLTPMDAYDVELWSIRGASAKLKDSVTGVHVSTLRQVIEQRTGLRLSLGTMGRSPNPAEPRPEVQQLSLIESASAPPPAAFRPGTRVWATYRHDPPRFHHVGTVLSIYDPEAWEGSIAFPPGRPSPSAVKRHVEAIRARYREDLAAGHPIPTAWREHGGPFKSDVPVRWDFGKVYWESVGHLRVEGRHENPADNLHQRIAEHLGWTLEETRSMSLPTLRDLVTSPKLRHEITLAMNERVVRRDNPYVPDAQRVRALARKHPANDPDRGMTSPVRRFPERPQGTGLPGLKLVRRYDVTVQVGRTLHSREVYGAEIMDVAARAQSAADAEFPGKKPLIVGIVPAHDGKKVRGRTHGRKHDERHERARALFHQASQIDEAKDIATLEEAERLYRQVIWLSPNLAEAHVNLGNTIWRLSNARGGEGGLRGHLRGMAETEAIGHFLDAIRIDPTIPEAHFNAGYLMWQRGWEPKEYVWHFEEAVKNGDRSFPEAYYALASAYAQTGQPQRALPLLETYLSIEPTGEWADLARKFLSEHGRKPKAG